ncbi:MAG: sulfatase-like hydrolase/transferase [Deltaproteobacteria bacterium]|nr:sulfatase-like hydrolase/transferase [Deltaproteobacteria bacterium]
MSNQIHRGLASLALISIAAKVAFLIQFASYGSEILSNMKVGDFIWIFLVDLQLYFGARILVDLIGLSPVTLPHKLRATVLYIARILICLACWYVVASAHYFLRMGDHLTLEVFIAADVTRMDYLTIQDQLVLLAEFIASFIFFFYLEARLPEVSGFVSWFLYSKRAALWIMCILLLVTASLLPGHVRSWTFNLDKHALVAAINSVFHFNRERFSQDYDFSVVPKLAVDTSDSRTNMHEPVEIPTFSGETRPNVVLFVMETAGARHLSAYGGTYPSTPNFETLRQKALFFERAYAHTSNSANAALSLFCSYYPHPSSWFAASKVSGLKCDSLQRILKGRGYTTALVSRWNFDFMGLSPLFLANDVDELHYSALDHPAAQKRLLKSEDEMIQYSIDWAANQSRPFFLTVWPVPAHIPGVELEEQFQKFGGQVKSYEDSFQNQLYYQDYLLGKLVQGLRSKGLWENTVLIAMGDHGEGVGKVGNDFAHSNSLYEDVARIPMMVVAPRLFKKEIRVPTIFQQVDLIPTTLGLLGVNEKFRHQGRDLTKPINQYDRIVYLSWPPGKMLALVEGQWKYIYHAESGFEQLFDLSSDPLEHRNMAGNFLTRTNNYNLLVKQWAMFQQQYYSSSGGDKDKAQREISLQDVPRSAKTGTGVRVVLPGHSGKLLGTTKVFADGFSIEAFNSVEFDLSETRVRLLRMSVGAEFGHCPEDTLEWTVSFEKDNEPFFSVVLSRCEQIENIELSLDGVKKLKVSFYYYTGEDNNNSDRQTENNRAQVLLGEPKLQIDLG